MNLIEETENGLFLVILGAIAVAGYLIYNWLQNGNPGPTDQAGQTSSLLGALQGTNSIDPTTGQSNGLWNSIVSTITPQTYPGGGQVAGSSETPSGATNEVLTHPLNSIESIFGYTPSN
jgi:hypothetical protein